MRLHRFYIREEIGNKQKLTISDAKLAHQLRNVFRFKVGDSVVLFDGSGFEYVSAIANLTSDKTDVTIGEKSDKCVTPQRRVHIFQSLIKKDNFEWILEKCTEIGVSEFTPIISERTEKKNLDSERAQRIIVEATEQSGRCAVPILNNQMSLTDLISGGKNNLIAFHQTGEKFESIKFGEEKELNVLVGPEGGWTDKELRLMKDADVKIYSLGPQTLRAETASIATASLLLL